MDAKQKRAIEMFARVDSYITGHPAPVGTSFDPAAQNLSDVVARLGGGAAGQSQGKRQTQATGRKLEAQVRSLRGNHLRPIVTIAKANVEGHPGIERAVRLPPNSLSVTKLLAEAQAIHDAAALYPPVFVDNGRPADFLEQLQGAIDAIRTSTLDRGRNLGLQVGSRAGIDQQIRRGRRVLNVLDALVRSAFGNDDRAMAEWALARRLSGVPAPKASSATPPATATPAASQASATSAGSDSASSATQPKAA